jgi:diacylglycerol kinase (ATP)
LRIALAYNPAMAPRRLARVAALAAALEAAGHRVAHHESAAFDCARDAPDAELLCIAGGDGTVRMVVANHSDPAALPPLAVFPVGTINLIARELEYPLSPAAFVRRVEQDRLLHSPLARMNGVPFVACLSIGIDAMVVASVSDSLKARIGRFAYAEALSRLLLRWPLHRMTVRTETETFEAGALFVLRSRFYAGPWTLHREAHLGHESLRVLVLPQARRRDIAALARRALRGMHVPHPSWRYLETEWLEVVSDEPVPVQADGDPVGVLPARVEMSSEMLRFR